MATRKKKADIIESAEMPNKSSGGWPKIQQGTHLTVKTFEDGHTELEWDDDVLLQEVRAALAGVKKASVRAKSVKKVPEAMKRKPVKEDASSPATVKKATAKKTTKGKTND